MAGRRDTGTRLLLEKEIEKMILQWLDLHANIFCWKQNTTGIYDPTEQKFRRLRGFARKGISDILMIVHPSGRMGAIEVKTPERAKICMRQYGFRCTPEQMDFIDRVKTCGGFAGVATSIEDAMFICRGNI